MPGVVATLAALVAGSSFALVSVTRSADRSEPSPPGPAELALPVEFDASRADPGVAGDEAEPAGPVPPPAPAVTPESKPSPLPAPKGDAVIAPPPEQFDGPPPTRVALPPALSRLSGVVPEGGTWAVVIGINDYPGSRGDLRSAVNDANDMDQALAQLGVAAERRAVLRDGQATSTGIDAAVAWLVAHAGPDAVAAFFFAGHVRKLGTGREAMVASDGSLFTDLELADRLSRLAARRVWVAIAACYAGGFTEVLRPGRVLTAAAPANALAYENLDFGRSYMVEYMVRRAMLGGQAPATVQSAFAFAVAQLTLQFPNRLPVQFDQSDGALSLRPAAPPAPVPVAPGPT
ncbi:MAG: caspase family protein, partial [Acidimicrobiales bacterium]